MEKRIASQFVFFYAQKEVNALGRGKRWLGLIIIAVSIMALGVWEKWGKNEVMYDEILVLKESVPRGTTVTEDMLIPVKREKDEKDCLTPEDKKNITGLETKFFVHGGVPVFSEYFEEKDCSPSSEKNEYTLAIPSHWIDSAPAAAVKGDMAVLYGGDTYITSARITRTDSENNCFEIIADDEDIRKIMKVINEGNKLIMACIQEGI